MRQLAQLRALLVASFLICCLATIAAAQDQTLPLNTPIERQLAAGESHNYAITLEENTLVQLVVEQRGIDVVVKVSAPNGKSLADFDSPNGTDGPENVSFAAATAGTYRITVTPLSQGDIAPGQYQIKLIELRQATEEELKQSKNLEAVKAKGIALLDEVETMIQEIRSPQTRVRAQLQAARLLWDSDEKRASKYLMAAANGVKELVSAVDPGTQEYMRDYSVISQLRGEIVNTLSVRDPDAALNFLYSTKLPGDPYGNDREQAIQENALELSVANQILINDPKRAVQLARQNLKHGYSGNLANTISNLRAKNPELASELANEVAAKLLREKLLKKPDAAYLSTSLISLCYIAKRRVQQSNPSGVVAERLLSEETCRELLQKSLQEALSFKSPAPGMYSTERDAAWSLLNGLQHLGPEIDRAVPGASESVAKRLAELNRAINPQQPVMEQVMTALNSDRPEAVFESIRKVPEEMREQLYIQVANAASANGDTARARQIINDYVTNPSRRRHALANLEQQEMYQAISRGKVDEALRTISALRTPRERANMLMQIARQIGPGHKRAAALNFLEQARALLAPGIQAQDQEQMTVLLELARAYSRYDSKRAFEIVEPLVDQLNELCTAARTLHGFGQEFYQHEELDLQNGNSLSQAATQLTSALGSLAIVNFERAKLTSDRLRLPEVRLRAYLDIAQQTIQGSR